MGKSMTGGWSAWCKPRRTGERGACCFAPPMPPKTPDVALYSQRERWATGQAVTWNSPDITTNFLGGEWQLTGTFDVKVRNLSDSVAARGAKLVVDVRPYGIGLETIATFDDVLDLSPLGEQARSFPVPAALAAGDQRVSLRVDVTHPADSSNANDQGEQAITGAFTHQAGRSFRFAFPIRNRASVTQAFHLAAQPSDIVIAVAAPDITLGPGQQATCDVDVSVPTGIVGTPAVNLWRELTIVATDAGGALIGGVTYVLRIDT